MEREIPATIFPNMGVMARLMDNEVEPMTEDEGCDLAALERISAFMESPFYKVDFEPLMTRFYNSALKGLRETAGGPDLYKNQVVMDICLTMKAFFDGKISTAMQVHEKYYSTARREEE